MGSISGLTRFAGLTIVFSPGSRGRCIRSRTTLRASFWSSGEYDFAAISPRSVNDCGSLSTQATRSTSSARAIKVEQQNAEWKM